MVDQLDDIDMADRDTKGDLYEYMLGKIASPWMSGANAAPQRVPAGNFQWLSFDPTWIILAAS